MTNDKSLSYYDRLEKFGLTTLETKRLRGDLIEVYKLFKGYDQGYDKGRKFISYGYN